jgi:hypothetical protein
MNGQQKAEANLQALEQWISLQTLRSTQTSSINEIIRQIINLMEVNLWQ